MYIIESALYGENVYIPAPPNKILTHFAVKLINTRAVHSSQRAQRPEIFSRFCFQPFLRSSSSRYSILVHKLRRASSSRFDYFIGRRINLRIYFYSRHRPQSSFLRVLFVGRVLPVIRVSAVYLYRGFSPNFPYQRARGA